MKLYTFLDEEDNIIEEILAINHDIAVAHGNNINFKTYFYSETISEKENDFKREYCC